MNADQGHTGTYFRFYLENHTKNVFDTSPLPFHDLATSNECHRFFNGSMLHSFHNPATHYSVGGYDVYDVLFI